MFLISALVVRIVMPAANEAAAKPFTISNAPGYFASAVYVGPDNQMPQGSGFLIAIHPPRSKDGELIKPVTMREALVMVRASLPRWYIRALTEGNAASECEVRVNGQSVNFALRSWLWVEWDMNNSTSPLRRELDSYNIVTGPENMVMGQAIDDAVCEYLSSGDLDRAVDVLVRWGKDSQQEAFVYVGDDNDMPTDARIAIGNGLSEAGLTMVPDSLATAFRTMWRALPGWYLQAFVNGKSRHECAVIINGEAYSEKVESWFWMRWKFAEPGNPLRTEMLSRIEKNTADSSVLSQLDETGLRLAFNEMFCEYVKTSVN
jgi:hypothetical protein